MITPIRPGIAERSATDPLDGRPQDRDLAIQGDLDCTHGIEPGIRALNGQGPWQVLVTGDRPEVQGFGTRRPSGIDSKLGRAVPSSHRAPGVRAVE